MPSKHAYAELLIRRGLYNNLRSFAELEQRISVLGDENTKIVGDAFEVFVEGYLATQQKMQVERVWLVGHGSSTGTRVPKMWALVKAPTIRRSYPCMGHSRPGPAGRRSSHVRYAPKATVGHQNAIGRDGPCVDGSELARRIFTLQAWSVQPSAFERGSHDRWP
jgi:hypothetical protein